MHSTDIAWAKKLILIIDKWCLFHSHASSRRSCSCAGHIPCRIFEILFEFHRAHCTYSWPTALFADELLSILAIRASLHHATGTAFWGPFLAKNSVNFASEGLMLLGCLHWPYRQSYPTLFAFLEILAEFHKISFCLMHCSAFFDCFISVGWKGISSRKTWIIYVA